MEKVPAAGFKIVGLPIRGIQRSLSVSNPTLPWKVLQSLLKARRSFVNSARMLQWSRRICQRAIVVHGDPDGHTRLDTRAKFLAGLTNRWLAKRVNKTVWPTRE